ncbi:RNA exonuclease 1 homolog isoform X2 [Anabas testudineus]|uniref:RNA exonuclease 1 homolog isoform X2 n=1 Tax=Anabas testudineus TaxID=64144 RepID=UPI000E4548C6|nr:RNA exonuclease 1 homolog isoform X2 [Anabas testudineus]
MFPSSGLFADIRCPVSKHGLCERPHCLYKHASEVRDMFVASPQPSAVDSAEVQNGCLYAVCGASVNETRDDCLQELERINKEIETVRHEVEEEQRRLSRYQTVHTGSKSAARNSSLAKTETTAKDIDGGSYLLSSCTDFTKTYSRARKYVVDNSKPRTDLEYDPLSNFSADLRSYSSSGKEQKHIKKDLKRKKTVPCDQKKILGHQAHPSRSPSPEPVDDSNEDDVLIIDIPPSPEKKRSRSQKLSDCIAGKSQNTEEELEVKTEPIAALPCFSNAECASASGIKANQDLTDLFGNKEYGNIAGCVPDQRGVNPTINNFQAAITEVEDSLEPASLSAAAHQQAHCLNTFVAEEEENVFQVESPQCELPLSVVKMNPLKPCDFPQTNSIFYKAPVANSDLQSGHHIEQPAYNRIYNHCSPKQMMPSSEPSQHLLGKAANAEVIIIESSSEEEELHYSELDLSDSDPMEECYRIFMEANNENKGNEEQSDMSVATMMGMEKSNEVDGKPQALAGKKRVAHEAKHTETLAKNRPQPQVLVPLRGPTTSAFGSQPSKIQQTQQRASMLTASVKGGQAFISSTCQRKPETQNSHSISSQALENLQPAPLQNAYMNYIPLGTTVIDMGNNLHLILPEGAFPLPVASSSSPVTSVLTPINQVHTSTLAVKQAYFPPAVTPVQRLRTAAPVLIPAPARNPSLTSAFATAQSTTPIAQTVSQPAAIAKPLPTKRKLKQQCEVAKVPHDVRQRYVNMFTKEFIKTAANVNDAFEKALAEERSVYNRSVNKLKYLSIAVNALKRLKNQSAVAAKDENQVDSQRAKGNIPFNLINFKGKDDAAFYESLTDYILTEEKLVESNFPVQHPEKPGCAALFADNKKGNTDSLKRICCRCGATYSVSRTGKHIRKEECNYHYGKAVENKVPGGVETRYSCCEGVMGAPGCQVFKLHVHDSLSLDGFVSTVPRHPSDTSCPGVYSLDCEMCYTIHGLELSRVTVVNSSLQVIYDTYVKPDNDVIDYNTRFSGISEEEVKGNHTSLREVQQTLLSFISADTILIGHGLEADLCTLKLLHGTVVDTSVVFPHRLGPPHKLTLNNLTAEYLRRIIQESVCGHDTAEDAAACMELMLWKVKEDGKLKK